MERLEQLCDWVLRLRRYRERRVLEGGPGPDKKVQNAKEEKRDL